MFIMRIFFPTKVQINMFTIHMLDLLQVLEAGGREPPTKPKGRPRKQECDAEVDSISRN